MILQDVVLLCAISSRTYAYVEAMVKEEMLPSVCWILAKEKTECTVERVNNKAEEVFFHTDENFVNLLERYKIRYKFLGTKDANEDVVFDVISDAKERYIIYSGYGGCILKKRLFELGKTFIHIHAGLLPEYRGSTTVYYSILKEDMIGATGIIMNDKIDEGDILLAKTYHLPKPGINIDYVYEPWVRSQVLCEILRGFIRDGRLKSIRQEEKAQETYFIIHPVLKHLALLHIEGNENDI